MNGGHQSGYQIVATKRARLTYEYNFSLFIKQSTILPIKEELVVRDSNGFVIFISGIQIPKVFN